MLTCRDFRSEIGRPAGAHPDRRCKQADVQGDLFQVLPAQVREVEPADHSPLDIYESPAGRGQQHATVLDGVHATLHGPGIDRLAGHEHRIQVFERLCDGGILIRRS